MSIRTKTIAVIAVTLVVLISALYVALGNILMSGFRAVEHADAQKNVLRVSDAIKADIDGIQNSLFTWTQWDPAYQYIEDRNQAFAKDNFSSTMFTGMKIAYCVFIDPRFQFPYAGGYDLKAGRDIPVPDELLRALTPDSVLLKNTDPNKAVRGILTLKDQTLLVAAAPITDTKGTAPARGHILFAKPLDAAEVKLLGDTTHLSVAVSRDVPPLEGIAVAAKNGDVIQGRTVLVDIAGRPALLMTVDVPREIYKQGTRSLQYLMVSIIAIGVVFGIVIAILVETIVLRRVLRVSALMTAKTQSLDFSETIPVQGRDEISRLTTSINGMICAVSEFLSQLQASDQGR
jgi:sensor domain CHASE-containing protein